MNPDQQEAESRKYSNAAIMVLPLRSGKVAVFNRAFQLYQIIDSPELFSICLSVPEAQTRVTVLKPGQQAFIISSDDLDI